MVVSPWSCLKAALALLKKSPAKPKSVAPFVAGELSLGDPLLTLLPTLKKLMPTGALPGPARQAIGPPAWP